MKNRNLAADYIKRSKARLKALKVLFDEASYADVVREAQEIVELSLKAVLRSNGVEPARIHDVSDQIEALKVDFKSDKIVKLEILIAASRELRRDRELAFYGGEDFTPGEFYKRSDGVRAMELADTALSAAEIFVIPKRSPAPTP